MSVRGGYIISDQYATHFLTFTIVGWVDLFSRKECRDIIIDAFEYCQQNKGLSLHAYVIMESHVHLIASASAKSSGLSDIIRDLKKHTSKKLLSWILNSRKESRREWLEIVFKYHAKYNTNNAKYQVWLQNNQPKVCIHPRFTTQKIEYIHNNPVVAGIVDRPEHYLYSSARNYLNRSDVLLKVDVIDFGVQQGYVMI